MTDRAPKSAHLRGQRTALTINAWPTSLEAQEWATNRRWGWVVHWLVQVVWGALFFLGLLSGSIWLVGMFLWPTALWLYLWFRKAVLLTEVESRVKEEQRTQRRQREEAEAAEQSPESLDLARLWALNNRRLDDYHDIARDQARNSFRSGQTAMTIGLLLVVGITVGLIVAQPTGASAIAFGAIGVAASAMTTYIGATFLRAQAHAQVQLGQFFVQPVETARLLSAERLVVVALPEDERRQAVQQILASTMPGVLPQVEPKPPAPRKKWWQRS